MPVVQTRVYLETDAFLSLAEVNIHYGHGSHHRLNRANVPLVGRPQERRLDHTRQLVIAAPDLALHVATAPPCHGRLSPPLVIRSRTPA